MKGISRKDQSLNYKDIDAFEELFGKHYGRMMGYTCMMVNEEVARDIIQDVFLYVWENRKRITFSERFGSYLIHLCYSRAVDYIRHKKLASEKLAPAQMSLLTTELNWMKDNNDDIINKINNRELMEQIDAFMDTLPESRREVFRLSYIGGFSNREISEKLEMPQRTVESHLYLSLRHLKEKFKTKKEEVV